MYRTEPGSSWDDLLTALAREFTDEIDIREEIRGSRYVDEATDAQLELIGDLVGCERRTNERDEHYRRRIKLQLPKFTRGATIDDIVELTATLLECSPSEIELIEGFDVEPARFAVQIEEYVFARLEGRVTIEEFEEFVQTVKPAGVRATATVGPLFTYRSVADHNSGINDPDRGYDNANYADLLTERFDEPGFDSRGRSIDSSGSDETTVTIAAPEEG